MVAEAGEVVDAHLGDRAHHLLLHTKPELADLRLRLGIRAPVVAHMLVLAGDLAVVAAVAFGRVDHKSKCHLHSPKSK